METQTFFTTALDAACDVAAAIEAGDASADDFDIDQIVDDAFDWDDEKQAFYQAVDEGDFWEIVEANEVDTDEGLRPGGVDRLTASGFKEVRKSLHFSQQHMANLLGVRRATLSHWEMGRDPIPYRVRHELDQVVAGQIEVLLDVRARLDG